MNNHRLSAVGVHSSHHLAKTKEPFLLVVDRGENLMDALIACAEAAELESASLSGLGALENPVLGCYLLDKKQYRFKTFPGIYELIALQGNITRHEGKYLAHVHVALGDEEYQMFAGHLKEALVGITAEITVIPFHAPISRKLHTDFDLNLVSTR